MSKTPLRVSFVGGGTDYFTDFKSYAKDPRILLDPKIEIISTDIPFMVIDPKRDWSRQINKLSKNSNYIKLISKIAIEKIDSNRRKQI